MSWGERRGERITVLCCGVTGCGYKVLGTVGLMSARFCPTHNTPLSAISYERVQAPPASRESSRKAA